MRQGRTLLTVAIFLIVAQTARAAIHDAIITHHDGLDFALVDVASDDVYLATVRFFGVSLELNLPVKTSVVIRQRDRALFVPPRGESLSRPTACLSS